MSNSNRPNGIIRDISPCWKCEERFPVCSGNCPKDTRGEFGYKAWRAKVESVKKAKKGHYELRTPRGYKLHWEGDK